MNIQSFVGEIVHDSGSFLVALATLGDPTQIEIILPP